MAGIGPNGVITGCPDRIEAVVTERSAAEIQIKLEAKLQQYLKSQYLVMLKRYTRDLRLSY
jgi:hypothetical protein